MNSKEIMKYSYVAELNYEAFLMTQNFVLDQLVRNNMILISLEEENENEETSEWVGFVKTMKIFINKKFGITNERLSITNDRLDRLEAKMEAGQAKMEASLEAIMNELKEKKWT